MKKTFTYSVFLILISSFLLTVNYRPIDHIQPSFIETTAEQAFTSPVTNEVTLLYPNHYHTVEELEMELQHLENHAPGLLSSFVVGQSVQGRDIRVIKLTNEQVKHTKPKVLFVAHHHAREQITVEASLLFIQKLINEYGDDVIITQLVDQLEIYIIPTLNPDGLQYRLGNDTLPANEWLRKNLQPYDTDNDGLIDEDPAEDVDGDGLIASYEIYEYDASNGNYHYTDYWLEGIDNDGDGLVNEDRIGGVDLNRNYDFNWNSSLADTGATGDVTDDTYPGTAPFSEPETTAFRDFVLQHRFANAMSLHSGINATYFPWSYYSNQWAEPSLYYNIYQDLQTLLPDSFTKGSQLPRQTLQNSGPRKASVAYTSAGDWGDWMYEEANCLVPMTFEIYHNQSSNNYYELYQSNSTHQIWKWKGMYGYFSPQPETIESLWHDIEEAFEYWLQLTPALHVSKLSKKQLIETEVGIQYQISCTIKNLSPRLSSQQAINVYYGNTAESNLIATNSVLEAKELRKLTFNITLATDGDLQNTTIFIGNEYVGYTPIALQNVSDHNAVNSFSAVLVPLSIMTLVVVVKRKTKEE